jgi:hypothetical protein
LPADWGTPQHAAPNPFESVCRTLGIRRCYYPTLTLVAVISLLFAAACCLLWRRLVLLFPVLPVLCQVRAFCGGKSPPLQAVVRHFPSGSYQQFNSILWSRYRYLATRMYGKQKNRKSFTTPFFCHAIYMAQCFGSVLITGICVSGYGSSILDECGSGF